MEIGFVLALDQRRGHVEVEKWIDCEPVNEEPIGAPIVNLEADFLIPEEMQGVDNTFARLQQLRQITDAKEKAGTLEWKKIGDWSYGARGGNTRGEWQDLRRAWLLTRKKQRPLANAGVSAASKNFYHDKPLTSFADWLFRFNSIVGGEKVKELMLTASIVLRPLDGTNEFKALLSHYEKSMASNRGRIYLDIFNGFFAGIDDFQQLLPRMAAGLDIDPGLQVSSGQFEKTKMFYGNAFEALGSLADFIAFTNNVIHGRAWNAFEQLSVENYLKLDKLSRFNPFANVPELSALCAEADNQLRNASHHGSMELDPTSRILTYRAGKGGQGEIRTMSYTEYLRRCIILFFQILAIFNLEIIVSQRMTNQPF